MDYHTTIVWTVDWSEPSEQSTCSVCAAYYIDWQLCMLMLSWSAEVTCHG